MTDTERVFVVVTTTLLMMVAFLIASTYLRRREQRKIREAFDAEFERKLDIYDEFPPAIAVVMAWGEDEGYPLYHRRKQDEVRKAMPVLSRALDRMVEK